MHLPALPACALRCVHATCHALLRISRLLTRGSPRAALPACCRNAIFAFAYCVRAIRFLSARTACNSVRAHICAAQRAHALHCARRARSRTESIMSLSTYSFSILSARQSILHAAFARVCLCTNTCHLTHYSLI